MASAEGRHSSEPQDVKWLPCHVLLCFTSSIVTVVRQQAKIQILVTAGKSFFCLFNTVFDVEWSKTIP